MLRWVVGVGVQLRFLVSAAAVAILVFGIAKVDELPVAALPEFEPLRIEVQTEALGLSAAEVEDLVTLNLEDILSGTSWVRSIESRSLPGLSSIRLVFEPGTDPMRARQLVQERLTLAYTLPNVARAPVMLQPLSATSRAVTIGLSSDEVSAIDMSVLARWTLRPKLMGVRGVANVAIWGERRRQLQVLFDPERLRTKGVSIEQLIKSAGDSMWVSPLTFLSASFPVAGGWIDTPNQRLEVRHVLPISSPGDLASISIDGSPFQLGDVAEVVEGHPPLIGDAVVNGEPGLLLVVEKLPDADEREVVRGVQAALDELRPGLPGIRIDSNIQQVSGFIEAALSNLGIALLAGAVLVLAVTAIFMSSWRAVLIAAVAMPVSLCSAGLILFVLGTTFNAMILAGFVLALAVVVDDAVIEVQTVARRLRQNRETASGKSAAVVIAESSQSSRGPLLYATAVIVMAAVPILFLTGELGAFVLPSAVAYLLALVVSMLVALVLTPALAALLGLRTAEGREPLVMAWLRANYRVVLDKAVGAPRRTAIVAVLLVAAGFVPVLMLDDALVPEFDERDLVVSVEAAPGTSQPAMQRIVARLSRELKAVPGVSSLGAHIGRAITGDQLADVDSSKIWISVDADADYDETRDAIETVVAGYPGLDLRVSTFLTQAMGQILAEADDRVVVRIYGPEQDELIRQAEAVSRVLTAVDGLSEVHVDSPINEPQIEIEVDLDVAGRYGLKPGDVRRATGTVLAGIEVGFLFEEQKVFDVVVWGVPETRESLTKIEELLITTPGGESVRLADLADVRIKPARSVMDREGSSRRIDVVAAVAERDAGAVIRDIKRQLELVAFPLEYHPAVFAGAIARQTGESRTLMVSAAAIVAIFLLFQAVFRSWTLALLISLTTVAAFSGSAVALMVSGGSVSLGSLIGLLGVVGIAARQSILTITQYERAGRQEDDPRRRALEMSGDAFNTVLTGAVAAAAALLPLALMGDRVGLEIAQPIAVVVLGGLIASTLINLFVVPVLYSVFGATVEAELPLEGDEANA